MVAEVAAQRPLGHQGVRRRLAATLAEADQYGTDLVLLDAPTPGSGKVFDWSLADEVPEGLRLILAGGLDPDNVADAVEVVEPWGVDVSTRRRALAGHEGPDRRSRRSSSDARAAAPDAVPRSRRAALRLGRRMTT